MKIDWNRKYNTIAVYAFLVIAAAILFVTFLVNLGNIFSFLGNLVGLTTPFILGFSIAYVLNPVMMFFEKRLFEGILRKHPLSSKANRVLSLLLAIILVLVFITLFGFILIPQIGSSLANLARNMNGYVSSATKVLEDWGNTLSSVFGGSGDMFGLADGLERIMDIAAKTLTEQIPNIVNYTKNFTSGVINVLVGFIVSVYLLASKERFFAQLKKILYAIFPKRFVETSVAAVHAANDTFSGFLYGKLLDSFIIGVMCYVGMLILRLPFPELISVVVGVTNVIPYFGPFLGAIPGILLIFIVDPIKSLWFAIFILALQQFDGNILGPRILGETTGLSAFWVIFAITVGGGLFGVLGMLLGVPLFSLIYALVRMLVESQLRKKGLPVSTYEYSSKRHPIPGREAVKEPGPNTSEK